MTKICFIVLLVVIWAIQSDASKEDLSEADQIAKRLDLLPHPEGGYFKETYRSPLSVTLENGSVRSLATSIYYLLESGDFSQWHRLTSDELWYFHSGSPLTIYEISPEGALITTKLGSPKQDDAVPQYLVKAGNWFSASVNRPDSYGMVGCVVAPGFDFHDFEMGDEEGLVSEFPEHEAIIKQFIHPPAPAAAA